MLTPAKPANEASRLAALRDLHILGTPPEERFDRITRIAAKLFNVPIALVSLIDENRQWFKSRQGLDAEQTGRDISFCGHAILQNDVFVIEDTLADFRFSDNPLVTGPPFIRFYAGAPLSGDDGAKLGTLCIIDRKPRPFGEPERALLRALAAWVERELAIVSEYQAMAIRLESKLRLAAVLEHLVEGVITTDSSGNIESINSVVTQIFGYSRDELAGANITLLIPPAQHAEHGTYMARLRAAPTPLPRHNFETTGVRKDGAELPLDVSFSDLVIGGKRLFVGIVRDITERREIERFKNEFVSTINHELRTPITTIIGALGLLRGSSTGLPKDSLALLDMACQNSERLSTLIDDFLDLEKIASGQMKFHLKPLEIAPFLEKAVNINSAYAEKFGVRFELPHPLPRAEVQADANRLMQVITNLMSNAAKFSPKGAAVDLTAEVRGTMLRVLVHDHGPGIPPEFRDRVFARFAQAGSPDQRQKGSSGLGLSICKAIVEKMGGSIGFESAPGQGATFYFDLPTAKNGK